MNLIELRAEKSRLVTRAREINELAEKENRNLSAEEKSNYELIVKDARELNDRIVREEEVSALAGVETRGAVTPVLDAVDIATNGNYQNSAEYRNAFNRWLVNGNAGLSPVEARALSTSNSAGGYLVAPMAIAEGLVKALDANIFVRSLATKYTLNGAKSLGIPKIGTDLEDLTVTNEGSGADEDTALAFAQRELTPRAYTKFLKVSNKLLRNANNVEGIIVDRLSASYMRTLEREYMTGDGTGNCLGVFIASNDGIATSSDVLSAADDAVTLDDALKLKYQLPSVYWNRPSTRFVMHSDIAFRLASTKFDGGYAWTESARAGEPSTLWGIGVVTTPYAPSAISAGTYTMLVGDFSYFAIADSLAFGVRRLEELYAITDETGFVAMLETDASPTLSGAFRRLKQAPE